MLKGTAQQFIGGIITSTAYMVFAVPLALVIVNYTPQGIRALWYGALFAVVYNFAWYTYLYYTIDWNTLFVKSRERFTRDNSSVSSSGHGQRRGGG